jgi:hypothetical protein
MDHRPFEDWLLDNKVLTSNEKRQLNAHLQTCPSCCALAEVDLALKMVKVAAPTAGFADRFQVRLAARKKALRQRNFWGFFILTMSVLSILMWVAWPLLASIIQSPENVLAAWLSSLLSLWIAIQVMVHAGEVAFKVIPSFVPPYIWTAILFAACGWSLLWVFSLMKFTKFPQGV